MVDKLPGSPEAVVSRSLMEISFRGCLGLLAFVATAVCGQDAPLGSGVAAREPPSAAPRPSTGDMPAGAEAAPANGADRTPPPLSERRPTSGDRLIESVAVQVAQHASIDAKIRYQAHLFGVDLVGSGVYLQQGRGPRMRMRLELSTQNREGANSLLQVNDGSYLWRERRVGDRRQVDRVYLRGVRRAWAKKSGRVFGAAAFDSPQVSLAMGGLPKLTAGLADCFQFSPERLFQLDKTTPALEVIGRWRSEKLVEMLPEQRERILAGGAADLSPLPDHVPHEVAVSVGRDDLFPYVIEYRRVRGDSASGADGAADDVALGGRRGEKGERRTAPTGRIALLQFHEVNLGGATIPARQFRYYPGDVDPADRTQRFLPQ